MRDFIQYPRSHRLKRRIRGIRPIAAFLPQLGLTDQNIGGAPATTHHDPVADVLGGVGNVRFQQPDDNKRPLLGLRGAVTYLDFQGGAELNMPLDLAQSFDDKKPFTFFATVQIGAAASPWPRILRIHGEEVPGDHATRSGLDLLPINLGEGRINLRAERWVSGHPHVSATASVQVGEFGTVALTYDGSNLTLFWGDQVAQVADTRTMDTTSIGILQLGCEGFVGSMYQAGFLDRAISEIEYSQLRAIGESLIALPRFPVYLPVDFEAAHSSLWAGTGCLVNNLTMFSDVPGLEITSGNEAWHRASRGIPVRHGVTYGFQTYYAAGTSGQIRCEGWADGGAITMRLDGPAGDVSVTNEIGGTFSNVQNIDHGGGIYELSFDVILQDLGQGDVSFGIGPNAPNSSVILFGNRMGNYGADLLRFPAAVGLNLLADPELNAAWGGLSTNTPLSMDFFGQYAGLRIQSGGQSWHGAEYDVGELVAGRRYSAVAYVELGTSGGARLDVRFSGTDGSEERVLRFLDGTVSNYANAAAAPETELHVADVKNVNGNIYRFELDFTSPSGLTNLTLKIGPQSDTAGEDVIGIVAGVFEVNGV